MECTVCYDGGCPYCSDGFLVESEPKKEKTHAQIKREAQEWSKQWNEYNRKVEELRK